MPNPINPKFDLEYQYQLYLRRVALDESTMHEQQKIQIKQAFFGAIGQLLILQRDETARLSETEAIDVFEVWIKQVADFWQADVKRYKESKRIRPTQ